MVNEDESTLVSLLQDGVKLLAWSQIAEAEGDASAASWLRKSSRACFASARDLRASLDEAESREAAQQLEIPS